MRVSLILYLLSLSCTMLTHCSVGGLFAEGVVLCQRVDYRLYIFYPDKNFYLITFAFIMMGGCIMGKNFFYFVFLFLSGQNFPQKQF